MKRFYERVSFCPRCGVKYQFDSFDQWNVLFACRHCGHDFYQNSIPSTVAVIPRRAASSEVLMMIRSTEPAVGKLALPGGFLRYDERPREGLCREVLEETSLHVRVDRLLCETILSYPYGGACLSVLELGFVTHPVDADLAGRASDEASSMAYHDAATLLCNPHALAFPEHQSVLEWYVKFLEPTGGTQGSGHDDSRPDHAAGTRSVLGSPGRR